jgi:hypothetical protein
LHYKSASFALNATPTQLPTAITSNTTMSFARFLLPLASLSLPLLPLLTSLRIQWKCTAYSDCVDTQNSNFCVADVIDSNDRLR